MALNIIISQIAHSQISQAAIFSDNQSAIFSTENLLSQSGQQILRFIIGYINTLREKGINLELHWVPAHKEIEENELADVAAKEATGWQKVKKRNGKLCERDTNHTASQIALPFLKSAGKAHLTKFLFEKWRKNGKTRQKATYFLKFPAHLPEKCYTYMASYQSG